MASERLAKCRDAATVLGGITEHVELLAKFPDRIVDARFDGALTAAMLRLHTERLLELIDEMRRSIAERRPSRRYSMAASLALHRSRP